MKPSERTGRRRIATFLGPTATIGNSPPLVTSNKARVRHALPLLQGPDGRPITVDTLRPQRLAAPVTVYVEPFAAHPLEAEVAHLYAAPDGWLDSAGEFHEGDAPAGGRAVYAVELHPDDGLLPLPYMARQADGSAWEDVTSAPGAPFESSRQSFYPDASRIYEEIDRLGVHASGRPIGLRDSADFDFYRAAPSGGWTQGIKADHRSDVGSGDIPAERRGEDFFGYYPTHLRSEPTLATLASLTNQVQETLAGGDYAGVQWLEGSPTTEETMYWLGLLIDTTVPLVGHAAQRTHGALSADGDRNIVDGVKYILSGIALDEDGVDRVGAVLVIDELVLAAREAAKTDARPGNYTAVGGHGGVVADMGGIGSPQLTFVPNRRHTHTSEVRHTLLPMSVTGVAGRLGKAISTVDVKIKDNDGRLLPAAMPHVTFAKYGRYVRSGLDPHGRPDPAGEVEILSRIEASLTGAPLAGFVAEGMSPYGFLDPSMSAALSVATYCGMPVVRVGRGNTGGMAYKNDPLGIAGNNLSATKARLLLMACLLKLGALPPAADPFDPTPTEARATRAALEQYQEIFDTH